MSTAASGSATDPTATFPPPDPETLSPGRPPRRSLSRRARTVIGGAAAVVLIAAGTATALSVHDALSWQRFDEAASSLVAAGEQHDEAVAEWDALEAAVDSETTRVRELLPELDPAAVDTGSRDAYIAAIDRLLDTADDVAVADRAALTPPDAPEAPQDRFGAADLLDARADGLTGEAAAQQEQADRVRPLLEEVRVAATAFTAGTASVGQALLDSSTAATHQSRLLLQRAIYGYGSTRIPLDLADPTTLDAYVAQVAGVQDSQADGLAERASADWPRKQEVLDFADSLAGGVPLDIEWKESIEIDGVAYGALDSGAGLASWTLEEGAPAAIQLTESIQRYWGEAWTEGLVAHEVGHAITGKEECYELYRAAPFDGDDERWATAWALSLGFTDGSGTEPYGDPGAEAVEVASACR